MSPEKSKKTERVYTNWTDYGSRPQERKTAETIFKTGTKPSLISGLEFTSTPTKSIGIPYDDALPLLFAEMTMRRTSIMTLGIVLIFFGVQLNLIETYVITSRFSNFVSHHASSAEEGAFGDNSGTSSSPFSPASFRGISGSGNQQPGLSQSGPHGLKTITPPTWICWPILFLGTVVFLHGLSMRQE